MEQQSAAGPLASQASRSHTRGHSSLLETSQDVGKSLAYSFREGAAYIPLDVLEQKLLLQTGLVMLTQGEQTMAKDTFVRCINQGR